MRTAPTNTKDGPWVTHYRVWRPGTYAKEGVVTGYYLDLRFKSGYEERWQVPAQVVTAAMQPDPTGDFVHRVLLGPGWTPKNKQSRYPHWPLG